ncbi:hypothetical protein C0J52_03713 [Blattella germanica]|nr:hypothetical protein C0J52_03713 [Blattella germanica]
MEAGVLSFNLYGLACNPEVQEKLRQEILNATKENGGALDYDSIQKLPYLDMVFSGMRFAIMQVKAAIVNIVSKFEIKTTDRTPIPFVANPKTFLLAAKDGLWLQIVPLKNN